MALMNVCTECFFSDGIKNFIKEKNREGKCNYCKQVVKNICSIACVIQYIEKRLDDDYKISKDGQFNIKDILAKVKFKANIDAETDIYSKLLSNHYLVRKDTDIESSPSEIQPRIIQWETFKDLITKQVRFFSKDHSIPYNSSGEEHTPSLILKIIQDFIINNSDDFIKTIGRDEVIFRARSDFKEAKYNCDTLGYPKIITRTATRMAASGIPVFYCSTNLKLAIQEIKSSAKKFIAGSWQSDKDLVIVNLTGLESLSIDFFGSRNKYSYQIFINEFCKEISKPVEKNKEEHVEYIPTQALAEWIKISFKDIHGIMYNSSHNNSSEKNLCLFPERVSFCTSSNNNQQPNCNLISFKIIII